MLALDDSLSGVSGWMCHNFSDNGTYLDMPGHGVYVSEDCLSVGADLGAIKKSARLEKYFWALTRRPILYRTRPW